MNRRSLPGPNETAGLSSGELRRNFLVENLFAPCEARLVHTGMDRLVVGGVMPEEEIRLESDPQPGSRFFLERRELGIINVGEAGMVSAGGEVYEMRRLDCLYIGMGEEQVSFRSCPEGRAAFYLLSAPAHRTHPTRKAGPEDATVHDIGSAESSSRRRLVQYIHEGGIESCQLVMGYTRLEPGSVWNTWPPHTHSRRSEVYFYFDAGENLVMHLMGEPERTRHLLVRDREAVLSPPWSIHCGAAAGAGGYSFIWGMAG
jgi:4-deoxy-L-threo-5-hexosulose-uronate ketol-isomerase